MSLMPCGFQVGTLISGESLSDFYLDRDTLSQNFTHPSDSVASDFLGRDSDIFLGCLCLSFSPTWLPESLLMIHPFPTPINSKSFQVCNLYAQVDHFTISRCDRHQLSPGFSHPRSHLTASRLFTLTPSGLCSGQQSEGGCEN